MDNVSVVTEGTVLLIITQVSSGLKTLHMPRSCKYKYLHVKIASLAVMKSCVTVGHFCEWQKHFDLCTRRGLVLSLA